MAGTRRDFLKSAGWMLAAAGAAGCVSRDFALTTGGTMTDFAAPPLGGRVRVGVIGLGARGHWALQRLVQIPGVEVTAVCDIRPERIPPEQAWRREYGFKPVPHEYTGSAEAWKKLCEDDTVDVVYSTTPWYLHAKTGVYAMKCGKHVMIEVPSAMTIDECWELVETAEATRRHCMQLENCCYGETELLCLNLCREGMLGDLVHGEAAYIHDLRTSNYGRYYGHWRLNWNAAHKGNQYPTHGLGPVCQYMDINRGDRFDYLVSLESGQRNFEAYAKAAFGADSEQARRRVEMGDMNVTMVKTVKGRSIMIQHDVSSPRPYSRLNTVTGTKGIFADYPYRVAWEEKPGAGAHGFFDAAKAAEVRKAHMHPMWKQIGQIAEKVGGHGGMDFLMDLRWAYCLQNGLPLDMSVYDLATWCSVCELSERSVRNKSRSVDVPDFTRGGWKTAPSLGIRTFDMSKIDLASMKPLKKTDVMEVHTLN